MFNGLWCLHLNTTIAVFSFFWSTQAPFEIKLCNFQVYTSSLSDQTIYLCFNLKIDSMQSISAQLVDNEDRLYAVYRPTAAQLVDNLMLLSFL